MPYATTNPATGETGRTIAAAVRELLSSCRT
jgi:hypothetical protein